MEKLSIWVSTKELNFVAYIKGFHNEIRTYFIAVIIFHLIEFNSKSTITMLALTAEFFMLAIKSSLLNT